MQRRTGGHNRTDRAKEGIGMRKTILAVAISWALLGATAVQAQAATDARPSDPQAQGITETDNSRATQGSTPSEATSPSSTARERVGSGQSNVDKPSTSGAYYPYSSGTAGDDPSEPKSTAVTPDTRVTDGVASVPDDRWTEADADGDGNLSQTELTKLDARLSSRFDAIDVDGDDKLTRQEFRSWEMSHQTGMDADQRTNPTSPPRSTRESTAPSSDAVKSGDKPATNDTDPSTAKPPGSSGD
jgi:hypothetical protein